MAVDIFLHLSNSIKGEAQDDSEKDNIDVLAWNWGMSQSGTTHVGSGGGSGKVDVQDISLQKYVDTSTTDLIKRCCSGEHIDDGYLLVRKAGGAKPVDYLKIEMKHIIISSYSTGGSSDGLDRVQESLTLNFRSFKLTYTPQDEKGAPKAALEAEWNMATNKADYGA